ncbi:TrgA family protein [Shimia sp.]|uniref:TrgA family protein n=1 Tax=Shimia sp. TaxID=1954381 RepID=UPI00356B145E
MPTAAKLVAALCLGLLAVVVAEMLKGLMPSGKIFGAFTPVSGLIGGIVGWRHLGPRAGEGAGRTISHAVTAVVILILAGLFVFASYEMLEQAMLHRYSEVMQALRGIVEIALGYGLYLVKTRVLAALAVGAVLSGLATEYAYRRWR